MVGKEGVAKRIDVFATAITVKMTAHEIRDLDLGGTPRRSRPLTTRFSSRQTSSRRNFRLKSEFSKCPDVTSTDFRIAS